MIHSVFAFLWRKTSRIKFLVDTLEYINSYAISHLGNCLVQEDDRRLPKPVIMKVIDTFLLGWSSRAKPYTVTLGNRTCFAYVMYISEHAIKSLVTVGIRHAFFHWHLSNFFFVDYDIKRLIWCVAIKLFGNSSIISSECNVMVSNT